MFVIGGNPYFWSQCLHHPTHQAIAAPRAFSTTCGIDTASRGLRVSIQLNMQPSQIGNRWSPKPAPKVIGRPGGAGKAGGTPGTHPAAHLVAHPAHCPAVHPMLRPVAYLVHCLGTHPAT